LTNNIVLRSFLQCCWCCLWRWWSLDKVNVVRVVGEDYVVAVFVVYDIMLLLLMMILMLSLFFMLSLLLMLLLLWSVKINLTNETKKMCQKVKTTSFCFSLNKKYNFLDLSFPKSPDSVSAKSSNRGQFHLRFTSSFYASWSQMHKKDNQIISVILPFWDLRGLKAACKMLMKLTTGRTSHFWKPKKTMKEI